jgi:hypothetical protein
MKYGEAFFPLPCPVGSHTSLFLLVFTQGCYLAVGGLWSSIKSFGLLSFAGIFVGAMKLTSVFYKHNTILDVTVTSCNCIKH